MGAAHRLQQEGERGETRASSNYTAPGALAVNSPRFDCRGLVAKKFVESPFGRLVVPFRVHSAGLGSLLRCLLSLLLRRGAGPLYGGGQVRLGRRGTRLRLGDRRRRLGEKTEQGALLRHVVLCVVVLLL